MSYLNVDIEMVQFPLHMFLTNKTTINTYLRFLVIYDTPLQHLGCVPLVESKKGFGVTDFSDLQFSVERQIQKRIYNHKTRDVTLL